MTRRTETTKAGIAVIESKWNGRGLMMRKNASVRPMFDMLCDLHFGNTHEYIYEMVAIASALQEAIGYVAWQKDVSILYIAAHGTKKGIHLHGNEVITRSKLCNMLSQIGQRDRSLNGLYLGSCEFGTRELAEFLLARDQQLKWVAGYSLESDFVDGTALDVMFFNSWLRNRGLFPNLGALKLIEKVAAELDKTCRGLINTWSENGHGPRAKPRLGMGFSIYARSGRKSKIVDLLRPEA